MARVQLELSTREMQRLEYIMESCDFNTRKEAFGNAFAALEWMVTETQAGRRICSFSDHDEDRHFLALPALQNVRVIGNRHRFAPLPEKNYDVSIEALGTAIRDDEEVPNLTHKAHFLGQTG